MHILEHITSPICSCVFTEGNTDPKWMSLNKTKIMACNIALGRGGFSFGENINIYSNSLGTSIQNPMLYFIPLPIPL